MSTVLYVVLSVIVLFLLWVISIYNSLVRSKIRTEESWSDIDVQLKRRYDLIPNLIETVKGYAQHEKDVFEKVTLARSQAMQAQTIQDKSQAENILTSTLKSLFAVSENYPDLKASQNFLKLQDELSDTENKIQAARRFYNSNVRDLNIKISVFPTNIFAKMLNFVKKEFFQAEEEEKGVPQVKF